MKQLSHQFSKLFDQLGLPSDPELIQQFIQMHTPLSPDMLLEDAPFWTPDQASFLKDSIKNDADWAEIVDHLNLVLHSSH